MSWRVELVGGPFCGTWYPVSNLPDDGVLKVRGFEKPVEVYRLETDDLDAEQRALIAPHPLRAAT